MRSRTDPIRSWRHALRGTWAAGVAAIALGAVWALAPAPQGAAAIDLPVPDPDGSAAAQALLRPAIDAAAFDVRIWHPDPRPAPPPDSTPPPPVQVREVRVELVLVAIIGEGADRSAALFDPDTDQITLVAQGDGVAGGLSVAEIGADFVQLRGGERSARLTLRAEGDP